MEYILLSLVGSFLFIEFTHTIKKILLKNIRNK